MKNKIKLQSRFINPLEVTYDVERVPIEYWTVKQLIDYYVKIFIDESFQRPYCWTKKEVLSWINSIIFNRIPSTFTITDNLSCGEWCKTISPLLSDSYDYFNNIIVKEKCPSISIDGNGRTTSTVGFFVPKADWPEKFPRKLYGNEQYEFTFSKGFKPSLEGFDDDGNGVRFTHSWKKRERLTFDKFPEELKIIMLNRKVLVSKLIRATEGDCHNEFLDLNQQHKITSQEERSAYPSQYSDCIRKDTKKNYWLSERVPKLKIAGRNLDEFIHSCYVYAGDEESRSSKGITPKKLDEAYKYKSSLTETNFTSSKTIVDSSLNIVENYDINGMLNNEKHKHFNWFMYYVYCKETNQKIHSEKELFEIFVAVHNTLWADEDTKWFVNKKDQPFSSLSSAFAGDKLTIRRNVIIEKMTEALSRSENKHIMTLVEPYIKDEKRLFDRSQKEEMFWIQGGRLAHYDKKSNYVPYRDADDPTGKRKISYSEIHDGTKWGGDHYPEPYEDGGLTVVSKDHQDDPKKHNGRLIQQKRNKEDGGRPPKEVPYQPVQPVSNFTTISTPV